MLSLLLVGGCLDIKLEDQYSDPDAIKTTDNARELLASDPTLASHPDLARQVYAMFDIAPGLIS